MGDLLELILDILIELCFTSDVKEKGTQYFRLFLVCILVILLFVFGINLLKETMEGGILYFALMGVVIYYMIKKKVMNKDRNE